MDKIDELVEPIQITFFDIIQNFVGHIPFLSAGLLTLLGTGIAASIASRVLTRFLSRTKLRPSLRQLARRLSTITTWGVGCLLTAMIVFPGLTPTKAIGGLGIVSLAVGFAFKDIFENFFAGILLLWRFPFEEGDVICCGDVAGEVTEVAMRMTKICRVSGELVVVPNSYLFKNPVEVYTHASTRRISIVVGVAYDTDLRQAVNVIKRALADCHTVKATAKPQVLALEFAASSIDLEVTWWTGSRPGDLRSSRGEVIPAIKRALSGASIEIPYPHMQLLGLNQSTN